jgi:hypothetical protein
LENISRDRACLGLKRLVRRYGGERVSAACTRALVIDGASCRSLDSILKNGLDRVAVVSEPPVLPIQHANLRGPAYYQHLLVDN